MFQQGLEFQGVRADKVPKHHKLKTPNSDHQNLRPTVHRPYGLGFRVLGSRVLGSSKRASHHTRKI